MQIIFSKKYLKKIIGYSFAFISFFSISFLSYADTFKFCNVSGQWWDKHGVWDLVQTDTALSGFDWNQIGTACPGRYPLSGTISNDHLTFRTQNPNPSDICADWFDYQGILSSDCKFITGTYINSKGKSGTFQLERDPKPSLQIINPAKNHPPFLIDANEKCQQFLS